MFKERLAILRTEKKLTHQQMADMLGITRQAYGNYETGKREPDNKTLQKLADFFEVSIDYLLGRTDDPSLETKKEKQHIIDDPELNLFFKDFASAPEEKRRQFMEIWEVIMKDQAKRKPGGKQGE